MGAKIEKKQSGVKAANGRDSSRRKRSAKSKALVTWRLPEVYPDPHDPLRASAVRLAYHCKCLLRTTSRNISELLNSGSMFREAAGMIDLLLMERQRVWDEARSRSALDAKWKAGAKAPRP